MNFITLMSLFGGNAAGGTSGKSGASSLILMVVMVVAMYFLMIRPQKKKQKEEQNMRDSIQIGDEITTIGGIMGRVVTVKDDSIVLETGADKTKMKFQRWAIQTNDTANERMEAERKAAADAKKAKTEKDAIDEKINGKKAKETKKVKNIVDEIPEEKEEKIEE
jgi:preprotein translocase subunit YajC